MEAVLGLKVLLIIMWGYSALHALRPAIHVPLRLLRGWIVGRMLRNHSSHHLRLYAETTCTVERVLLLLTMLIMLLRMCLLLRLVTLLVCVCQRQATGLVLHAKWRVICTRSRQRRVALHTLADVLAHHRWALWTRKRAVGILLLLLS